MQILKIGGNIYRVVRRLEPDDFSDLKSFAPVIATPKRLKGERVTDDRLWSDVEEQYAKLSDDVRREIERADRRIYDAHRIERPSGASGPSGRRINNRPTGGHFVAIDSEGVTIDYKKIAKKVKGKIETTEKFDQRTVLWMAGGAEDYDNVYIEDKTGAGFHSEEIFEHLLSLPKEYAAPNASGKQPVFVSFGFSYDVGQLVKDLPYNKGWEIHKGIPFEQRNDKTARSSRNRVTL